jgi:oxygen-independent coproporphyrinogen-3 oxidase
MSHAGSAEDRTRDGPVPASQLIAEFAMNALRLRHGFAAALFPSRTGLPSDAIDLVLTEAYARQWLELEHGIIRPTELGYRYLNDLQLLFLP